MRTTKRRLEERQSPAHYTVFPGHEHQRKLRVGAIRHKERRWLTKRKGHAKGEITGVFRMTCIFQIRVALVVKPSEGENHSKPRQGESGGISK